MPDRRRTAPVLDASALLILILREPGADRVHDALPGALLSTVNLAEVLARIARVGADPRPVPGYLASLGVETVPFDEPLARMASRISGATRRTGLSLGDCACLATAALEERPALTADRAWKSVKVGVDIRLVR